MDTKKLAMTTAALESGSLISIAKNFNCDVDTIISAIREIESLVETRLFKFSETSAKNITPTKTGVKFLRQSLRFLDRESELIDMFRQRIGSRPLHIVTSHYLATYILIDLISQYMIQNPVSQLRLSVRTEMQVLGSALQSNECTIGICAPMEFPEMLRYVPWFQMNWSLVVPEGHRFAQYDNIELKDLRDEEIITFEQSSTGRQHIIEGFHSQGITPRISMQSTTTALIVQMVAARMGISILPLHESGRVTQNLPVAVIPISDPIRPIETGFFIREDYADSEDVVDFFEFALKTPV